MRVPDDPRRLNGFKNINLVTDLGVIDLLREVSGVGAYADVSAKSSVATLYGMTLQVLDIGALIAAKTAAGRAKDKIGVMHLEAVRRKLQSRDQA
jgi:hypothetical protein